MKTIRLELKLERGAGVAFSEPGYMYLSLLI